MKNYINDFKEMRSYLLGERKRRSVSVCSSVACGNRCVHNFPGR